MYYQEKIKEINRKINEIKKGEKTVVWPCGGHTMAMFGHTDLPCYLDQLEFVDKSKAGGLYMGKTIKEPGEVDWKEVQYAVISTLDYQESIKKELIEKWGFQGNIVSFYQGDVREFYCLYDAVHGISWGEEAATWEEAEAHSDLAYQDNSVLDFNIRETRRIMGDPGVPNYFIISHILSGCIQNKRTVLVDYGGALGNEYYRNRPFLDELNIDYNWCVTDLKLNVDYGRQNLETEKLHFSSSVDEIKERYGTANYIVYLRGSLQYMPDAYEVLKSFQVLNPEKIILEKTPVAEREHIVIQRVRDYGHGGIFPLRIFEENKLIREIETTGYTLAESEKEVDMAFSDFSAYYKIMVFKRREQDM